MRRKRRITLTEYVGTRCRDIDGLGGEVERLRSRDLGAEVIIDARVRFGAERAALLAIFEVIRIAAGSAYRHKYGYEALLADEFLFRYDLDPVAHPELPIHKHLPPDGERREECEGEVALRLAAKELWDEMERRDTG